jgi:hypothetical protein
MVLMPPNQNEYQFILDPSNGASGGPAFLQDPKKRSIITVLFVSIILLIVFIVIAIIASLGGRSTSAIVDVAAYQTELVRISTLGLADAKDSSVRAQTATLQAFMQSDLSKTTSFLASKGKKLEPTDTALRRDSSVDENLASAALRNRFEEELISSLQSTSSAYRVSLESALNSSSNTEETALLQIALKNVVVFEGTL